MPVPVDVAKKDVLIHMTPRKLFLGYKDKYVPVGPVEARVEKGHNGC